MVKLVTFIFKDDEEADRFFEEHEDFRYGDVKVSISEHFE